METVFLCWLDFCSVYQPSMCFQERNGCLKAFISIGPVRDGSRGWNRLLAAFATLVSSFFRGNLVRAGLREKWEASLKWRVVMEM